MYLLTGTQRDATLERAIRVGCVVEGGGGGRRVSLDVITDVGASICLHDEVQLFPWKGRACRPSALPTGEPRTPLKAVGVAVVAATSDVAPVGNPACPSVGDLCTTTLVSNGCGVWT